MIQKLDNKSREALEAAAFRRLISHLQNHTDVQNIDLMNLASFCRNCLSGWYQEEAKKRGIVLGKDEAREIIYGMPYAQWKETHQHEVTPQQLKKFQDNSPSDI